jgi:hypothetical protein
MNLEYIIDKFDKLPYRESINRIKFDHWTNGKSYIHPINSISPYTRIERILQNNIGKSFDLVFSYYCKQVPKYQQHLFLEEFTKYNRWRSRYSYYYTDDEGNIQHWEKQYPKKPIKFNIIPNVYGYQYESNGKIKIQLKEPLFWKWGGSWRNTAYTQILLKDNALYFESKNDRTFKRLNAEKIQKHKLECKREKKTPKLSQQEFRAILNAKKLKDKEENLAKIISHGFDPITSFTKRKYE